MMILNQIIQNRNILLSQIYIFNIVTIICIFLIIIIIFIFIKKTPKKIYIRDLSLNQEEVQILSDIEVNLRIEPFLNDLSIETFCGEWINNENKIIKNFNEKKGKIYIKFNPLFYTSHISLSLVIKIFDGEFNDNYVIIKPNFHISKQTLSSDLKFIFSEKKLKNNVSSIKGILQLDKIKNLRIKKGNLFFNQEYIEITIDKFLLEITMDDRYTRFIKGYLISSDLNLDINFTLTYHHHHENSFFLIHFSIPFIIISIIHCFIYISIKINCSLGKINPKSISPYFILFNMVWNIDSAIIILYLGILNLDNRFPILIPSVLYIFNFSIIETQLLYHSYKSQEEFVEIQRQMENNNETNENINLQIQLLFKKKFLKLYIFLYALIFTSIISMFILFSNLLFMYLINIIVFIPQIIYNLKVKILKNKIPNKMIFIIIIDRIFIVFSFRGYKNNILNSKPNNTFCCLTLITILIEVLLLYLQRIIGNKFFIPKKFRKGYYNYYKTINEIEQKFNHINKNNFQNEIQICSICLLPIIKQLINENNTNLNIAENSIEMIQKSEIQPIKILENQKENQMKIKRKFFHCLKKYNNNDYIMVTPCNHLFHPNCLKRWCLYKNECPICRKLIPLIE